MFTGVHSAKVALLAERAEVIVDPLTVTSDDLIREVEAVGFEAR